jgi:hypothetical protein
VAALRDPRRTLEAGHRLQLVEKLEAAARAATAHHALPTLAGWLQRVAATLRNRWPDTDLDLTDPAVLRPYRPRS